MGIKIYLNKQGLYFSLRFFDFDLGFHINQYVFGVVRTIGVRNCVGSKRITFLDYDETLFEEMLLPELRYLQEKYGLSDFYIFKSSQKPHAYHCINLDLLSIADWYAVLQDSSCDMAFQNIARKDFKTAVLRIAPKGASNAPKFITKLKGVYDGRIKSLAHAKYLHFHQGVDISNINNLDDNHTLIYVNYATMNFMKRKGEK